MKKRQAKNIDRGRIEKIKLKRSIVLNAKVIDHATIEIDHINHGLDLVAGKLNKSKRTQFTVNDIEKFTMMLDGEEIKTEKHKGKRSHFNFRINCPIKGKFFDKEFLMVFALYDDEENRIHTITIIPGWRK